MNETFNLNRFWTYFKFDLKQMWRNHSKAAILIGGASALFYIIWVMASLIFTQTWSSPVIVARFVVLVLAFAVLELYQAHTYGHLTEKRAGSSWLMIPASRAEKFVSMLLMTLVVIPVLFFAVYFLIDGFLSLVDPTYGEALITGFFGTYEKLINGISAFNADSPISFTAGSLVFPAIVGFFCNFLYFLLCGICFKKNKIVYGLLILFAISTFLSLLSGLLLPFFGEHIEFLSSASSEDVARWATNFMNGTVFLSCLLAIGLGWGVWRRIKTLQH